MKRIAKVISIIVLATFASQAAEPKKKRAKRNVTFEYRFDDNLKQTADSKARQELWFRDAKFGAFIHFGVYSTLEGPSIRCSWIRRTGISGSNRTRLP